MLQLSDLQHACELVWALTAVRACWQQCHCHRMDKLYSMSARQMPATMLVADRDDQRCLGINSGRKECRHGQAVRTDTNSAQLVLCGGSSVILPLVYAIARPTSRSKDSLLTVRV
jgi:hypothetical protein